MYNEVLRVMPPPPDFVVYEEIPFRIEDFYFEIGVLIFFTAFAIVVKFIGGNRRKDIN